MFTEGGVAYTYIHRGRCPRCLLREASQIHTFTEEVATDVTEGEGLHMHTFRKLPEVFTEGSHIHTFTEKVATNVY